MLGGATVRRPAERGAAVVIIDRESDQGSALADSLGDRVRFSSADVTDPLAVQGAVEIAMELGTAARGGELCRNVDCGAHGRSQRPAARSGQFSLHPRRQRGWDLQCDASRCGRHGTTEAGGDGERGL